MAPRAVFIIAIGELRRLRAWTFAAVSVADQQQFIAEVRGHGRVVASTPFYAEWLAAFALMCALGLLSAGILLKTQGVTRRYSGLETP